MADVANLMDLFSDIELSEEQITALDDFFKQHREKIVKEVMEEHKLSSENTNVIDEEKYVSREDAEKAFELFENDCREAFDLFEKDAERAFELFEEDAEKAFELANEDLKKEYTENMAKALQEVYSDIEERVKKDFMESKEYKTISKIKDLILPLLEESDHDLVEKIKSISEEKEKVEKENKELSREKTINILMKDIPAEYSETIEAFISKGKSEDEIIERFNAIIEMMETGQKVETTERPKFAKRSKEETTPVTEEKKEDKKEEQKPITEENVEHTFEYETLKKEIETKENSLSAFTEDERNMLTRIGLA